MRLPPLGLVADLQALLEEPSPRLTGAAVPGLDLRRYEDRVVGPLVANRRRSALADAYASLPARWRGPAVAALAERACEAFEPDGVWWESAALRAWLARTDSEAWDASVAGLPEGGVELQRRVSAMCGRVLDWTAADVHLVKHLPALATRGQRLLVRQLLEASAALDARLPRTVRPRARAGLVSTRLEEEDTYPAGGFSALTTSGAPENLVASELVYMEDGGGIDLFDVRWAEGELLYYTRDESAHLRRRRRVTVGLSEDLVEARVKDAGLPWQRLVLALGALHAVIERVVRWLGEAELRIRVRPVGDALADEAAAVELVLRPQVDAGIVSVEPVRTAVLAAAVEEDLRHGDTDVVWVTAKAPPPPLPVAPHVLEVGARGLEAWVAAANALAAHLA